MMKRQLDATRGGLANQDEGLPSAYFSSLMDRPHVAQRQVVEEQAPVPLPLFKRLRITSGCSSHDCTSTISDINNNDGFEQEPPSLMYAQQHHSSQQPTHYYSDRWTQQQSETTTTAVVHGMLNTHSPYANINQMLGNLHRERRNRAQVYAGNSNAYESDEGGRSTSDYLEYLLYTNNNPEHSDTNSTSSLSSCTTAQHQTAATHHHALVVDNIPRSYRVPSLPRTKLYTDSRLL